jgi:hypothetical protein
MLIGMLGLFFLMAGSPEEPKPAPKDDKPREGSYEGVDPFDTRYVEVTAYVDPGQVVVQRVEVLPGVARALLTDSSRLRVHLLDAKGGLLQDSGLPNPLAERAYVDHDGLAAPPPSVEFPGTGHGPHGMIDLPDATMIIVLPLLPDLATVSLGWIDLGLQDQDVRTEIRDACAKDSNPTCQAWMKKNP